jgi:hypothetical protein
MTIQASNHHLKLRQCVGGASRRLEHRGIVRAYFFNKISK